MRRAAQPAKAEPPPAEEGSLPHPVHLQAATPLDATLQVRRQRPAPPPTSTRRCRRRRRRHRRCL